MTNEERQLIASCPLSVTGGEAFISYITPELERLGFAAEYTEASDSPVVECNRDKIYPFDFVDGGGAIVVPHGDTFDFTARIKAAEYIAGYCAFWNVEGCEWLQLSLPAIQRGETSVAALRTAAYMCARIAANIAVGREVKKFPRFYLCKNLE